MWKRYIHVFKGGRPIGKIKVSLCLSYQTSFFTVFVFTHFYIFIFLYFLEQIFLFSCTGLAVLPMGVNNWVKKRRGKQTALLSVTSSFLPRETSSHSLCLLYSYPVFISHSNENEKLMVSSGVWSYLSQSTNREVLLEAAFFCFYYPLFSMSISRGESQLFCLFLGQLCNQGIIVASGI